MAQIEITCHSCGATLIFQDTVGRREECPKCRNDVRVCKNCEFYDPKAYNECHETSADPVQEKERSTLCDFFRPNQKNRAGKGSSADLLAAAEALFKKNN